MDTDSADSASEIVKFTISIPRESCTNAKAKYSSSVVPPDHSVHFYHWPTLPKKRRSVARSWRGDQIHSVGTTSKVGRHASHGSHRVVAPVALLHVLAGCSVDTDNSERVKGPRPWSYISGVGQWVTPGVRAPSHDDQSHLRDLHQKIYTVAKQKLSACTLCSWLYNRL